MPLTPEQIKTRWQQHQKEGFFARQPRWWSWRVNKKLAMWTGKPRKREAELFWGQPMTIVYPEFVSARIGKHGHFEPELTDMFIDVLKPGMTFYDVGSHYGYCSLLASSLVGKAGKVIALEPTAETFAILSENADRRDNITCHNTAAYHETGEVTFWDQGTRGSSVNFIIGKDNEPGDELTKQGKKITVPAVKLDEFVVENGDPDFLKIDAEGAEGPILEGMADLINRTHPAISLEVGDEISAGTGNHPCRENVQWLLDRGYAAFDYKTGVAVPHQPEEHYGYNNLLFRHPEWRYA